MQMIEDKYIGSRETRETVQLPLGGLPSPVEITHVKLTMGDFPMALLATSSNRIHELLGFSAFITNHNSSLIAVEPRFLELRMLKVDKAFFGSGIGKALLNASKALAAEMKRVLILKPERPGEYMYEQDRAKDFPLTTEQLCHMYQRNGFRSFTKTEGDDLIAKMADKDLTAQLWFDGIDPITMEKTGPKRYSMSHEEAASLSHIPLQRKRELAIQHRVMIDLNQMDRIYRERVNKHLVVAGYENQMPLQGEESSVTVPA